MLRLKGHLSWLGWAAGPYSPGAATDILSHCADARWATNSCSAGATLGMFCLCIQGPGQVTLQAGQPDAPSDVAPASHAALRCAMAACAPDVLVGASLAPACPAGPSAAPARCLRCALILASTADTGAGVAPLRTSSPHQRTLQASMLGGYSPCAPHQGLPAM